MPTMRFIPCQSELVHWLVNWVDAIKRDYTLVTIPESRALPPAAQAKAPALRRWKRQLESEDAVLVSSSFLDGNTWDKRSFVAASSTG